MAYDPVRRRVVIFGSNGDLDETWEWDGNRLWLMEPANRPPGRAAARMAYDPISRRVILYGGSQKPNVILGDTWSWNGRDWVQLHPATRPPAVAGQAMTTDLSRNRIVMFGGGTRWPGLGGGDAGCIDETWEWIGNDWVRMRPQGPVPPARYVADMAYNPANQRVTLFGGYTPIVWLPDDVWEWDGTRWHQHVASGPGIRAAHAMCTDPDGRGVLFGYGDAWVPQHKPDLWLWDGAAWTLIEATSRPGHRRFSIAVLDHHRRQVMLYGGDLGGIAGGNRRAPSVWTWSQSLGWQRPYAGWGPEEQKQLFLAPRFGPMAYDDERREVVTVSSVTNSTGTVTETWTFDGAEWHEHLNHGLSYREFYAIGYHAGLERVVLFGGKTRRVSGSDNDTWLWDGQRWTEDPRQPRPPIQQIYLFTGGMAYDPQRGKLVLFTVEQGETWEYDAGGWTQRSPANSPVRGLMSMTYDPRLGRVVGYRRPGTASQPQVWSWDGSDWTWHTTATNPDITRPLGFHYVPALGGCALNGESVANNRWDPRTWLWDGTDWRVLPATLGDTSFSALPGYSVYDPTTQRLYTFFHYNGTYPNHPAWVLDFGSLRIPEPYPRPGERLRCELDLPAHANKLAVLGLSFGRSPDLPLRQVPGIGWEHLPLALDALLLASLSAPLATTLDAQGQATFDLPLPPGRNMREVELYAAGVVLGPGGVDAITQRRWVKVIP